jgi:hypothetical protein
MAINVCSNNNSVSKNTTFTFTNPHQNDVTVEQDGTNTWPFSSPDSPFTVLANGGTKDVTTIGTAGNYCYKTVGCPDKVEVNPKNIVIT